MKKYEPIKDYHNELGYQKEELVKRLPENLIPNIKEVFKIKGLEYEKDIMQCTLFINPDKGSSFLLHKYVDFLNKGDFLCAFNQNGTGFHSSILL